MSSTLNSNAGDRDKVLTYGSGPRQCIGKMLAQKLLRVRRVIILSLVKPDSIRRHIYKVHNT